MTVVHVGVEALPAQLALTLIALACASWWGGRKVTGGVLLACLVGWFAVSLGAETTDQPYFWICPPPWTFEWMVSWWCW